MTRRENQRRIGLFGGSFDPPHRSHRRLIEAALREASIDRLVVVPCREHPWKGDSIEARATDRFEMCRLGFEGIDRCLVSSIELDRDGPSYTVETVGQFALLHPESRIALLIGADNVEGLPKWHRGPELIDLVDLIIYPRDGSPRPDRLPDRAVWLDLPADDVSSTRIRATLRTGGRPKDLDPKVLDFIERHSLYRGSDR